MGTAFTVNFRTRTLCQPKTVLFSTDAFTAKIPGALEAKEDYRQQQVLSHRNSSKSLLLRNYGVGT